MNKKKTVFLEGTRADFRILNSLIEITQSSKNYEAHFLETGIHMNLLCVSIIDEMKECRFSNIYLFVNHNLIHTMDYTLSKTVPRS